MAYQQARSFLDRFPRFEVKPGLSRIQFLAQQLGNPHRCFPTIHVAGTNGKGSVVATLDAILRAAGYRVGRFGKGVWPSKHAFRGRDSFGERFKSFDAFLKDRKDMSLCQERK